MREIQFESRDWLITEEGVEEIEKIPLYSEEKQFYGFETPDTNPVVKLRDTVYDYDNSELGFLSEILRVRNYGFESPQAVMIDTIRASRGADVELDKLVSIISSKENERASIEKRVENMLEKINPYILGVCLARISCLIIEDREDMESKMSLFMARKMSLGVAFPGNEADNDNYNQNFFLLCTDETSLEAVKKYASEKAVSKRCYDSKEELYKRDIKFCESVFTHEFGHLLSAILNMNDSSGTKEDSVIDFSNKTRRKINDYYKGYNDKLTHMFDSKEEFLAYSFDLWLNSPRKLEEEYREMYELLEDTLSKDITLEQVKE